ncbi:metal-dependent hydrolase [Jonesia quinghaiensis]|uniref:metal-dependent hydrolase n=1 Tax=Jonesia quinghaiensis TaxID=262806 RepID=UPI000403C528|nr:metal-dependent hydrolase [Jonesia quinghaiensis]
MMGSTHAATGAAAWLALAGTVPGTLGIVGDFDNAGLAAGMAVAAGAALLPDIDHHNGTIAHSLPPVSNLAAKLSENLSGGHRKGTHSLFGLGLASAASIGAARLQLELDGTGTLHIGAGIGAILLCAFALRALNLTEGRLLTWIASLGLAVCVVLFASNNWVWFPSAVAIGYAAHLIGDLVTTGGIPVTWPFVMKPPKWWRRAPVLSDVWRASGNLSFPILGDSGSKREELLLSVLTMWMLWVSVSQWLGFDAVLWLATVSGALRNG